MRIKMPQNGISCEYGQKDKELLNNKACSMSRTENKNILKIECLVQSNYRSVGSCFFGVCLCNSQTIKPGASRNIIADLILKRLECFSLRKRMPSEKGRWFMFEKGQRSEKNCDFRLNKGFESLFLLEGLKKQILWNCKIRVECVTVACIFEFEISRYKNS